jgi:uncharacterized protein (DUF2126 family)
LLLYASPKLLVMNTSETFEAAVRRHDRDLAALGLALWVGSEPTFTDRLSHAPHWLSAALGGDKLQRAQALLRDMCTRNPAALTLRSAGRLYPGEKRPRWNLGLLHNRDGRVLWCGPPDPMLLPEPVAATFDLPQWAKALAQEFALQGWETRVSEPVQVGSVWRVHTALQTGTEWQFELFADVNGPHLDQGAPDNGDEPVSATMADPVEGGLCTPALTLPPILEVAQLRQVLACIERATVKCALPALAWYGALPPVDDTLALTTITPDPAVIEVNCAPSASASEFWQRSQLVYDCAQSQGLSPYRLYYNGMVADSGGAGQITLGGPSPLQSPFLQHPALLPRLVRYLNQHPALSYLFAHDHVGSSGQSVRADERGQDAFDDLQLELALLARQTGVEPEQLWRSMAPFLCDASGNSHRAEVNIEKLWNPYLPGRGCLGLVEFRALRMQHSPQRVTALACLLRAVVALMLRQGEPAALIDWGRALHDRFALPFYLVQDLQAVLAQLDRNGLGLGLPIERVLRLDEFRFLGQLQIAGGTLELRRAIEFWPLLGDSASPEQSGTSRLVDASTARVELRWRPKRTPDAATTSQVWDWYAGNIRLPMRIECDDDGPLQVLGLRYRSFVPNAGLHPTLGAQAPLTLQLRPRAGPLCYEVQWHEWHPLGAGYDGLPADLQQAQARRLERLTLRSITRASAEPPSSALPGAAGLHSCSVDLRYLQAADQA